jgi:hypothetical protein
MKWWEVAIGFVWLIQFIWLIANYTLINQLLFLFMSFVYLYIMFEYGEKRTTQNKAE